MKKRNPFFTFLVGLFILFLAIYYSYTETLIGRASGVITIDEIGSKMFWGIISLHFLVALACIFYSGFLYSYRNNEKQSKNNQGYGKE